MYYTKKHDLKKQFKVEILKNIKIIDNESYDFIEARQFFPNSEEALKYIETLKIRLEPGWVIRYFKKVEEQWEPIEMDQTEF